MHFATYFDRHYLDRGLCLYRSLLRHSPPFRLWVLCLDDETHDVLSRLDLPHVRLIALAELEQADPALHAVKCTRRPIEYYWTCTAPLLRYLFARQPEIQLLTYLDADLYFFADPSPVYEQLGEHAILVVEHRRSRGVKPRSRKMGTYNVGLLPFRRGPTAFACLERWRQQCLEWCFFRLEEERYGDQKYLDDWPTRYDGVVVLQHKGAGVAIWNVGNYRFHSEAGRILVDQDPLIFYHFSHCRRITPWLYDTSLWRTRTPLDPIVESAIYAPYVRERNAAWTLVQKVGGTPPPADNLLWRRESTARLVRRALTKRTYVIVPPVPSSIVEELVVDCVRDGLPLTHANQLGEPDPA